jgi:hypothetical protein
VREDICPPALVFHFRRVGLALDDFFDYETGSFEIALDACGGKK